MLENSELTPYANLPLHKSRSTCDNGTSLFVLRHYCNLTDLLRAHVASPFCRFSRYLPNLLCPRPCSGFIVKRRIIAGCKRSSQKLSNRNIRDWHLKIGWKHTIFGYRLKTVLQCHQHNRNLIRIKIYQGYVHYGRCSKYACVVYQNDSGSHRLFLNPDKFDGFQILHCLWIFQYAFYNSLMDIVDQSRNVQVFSHVGPKNYCL